MSKPNPIFANKTKNNHALKRIKAPVLDWKPIWPRADPEALRHFDPASKVCTMNCGPSLSDPRSAEERKFLCEDCIVLEKQDDGPLHSGR